MKASMPVQILVCLLLLTILLTLAACHDQCQVYQERCTANMAEICSGDKDWQEMMDCDEVNPPGWVCCEFASPDAGITASCASSKEECERWNQ